MSDRRIAWLRRHRASFELCATLKFPKDAEPHQQGSTLQVNILHNFSAEIHWLELPVIETSQAIANAKDLIIWDTIIFKGEDNVLYDIIQTGA